MPLSGILVALHGADDIPENPNPHQAAMDDLQLGSERILKGCPFPGERTGLLCNV